jgi:anti-anti-sigma factor
MSELRVETTELPTGVIIVRPDGDVVHGRGAVELRAVLEDCVGRGHRLIVVDVGGVRKLDAAGIGVLVFAHALGQSCGTRIVLINLTRRTREVLVLTKLLVVFEPPSCEAKAA